MNKKITIVIFSFLLLIIPIWIWVVAPQLTKLPKNFSYKADVVSLDNFYNEAKQQFSGEARSVTKFSYEVVNQKQGNLIIKNVFDVRKITGEKIFAVERLYGIDPRTGEHAAGFGDRDRDGYLFAPKNLQKGEPFTYWHINYDGPAHMIFAGEDDINGLHVYRYETHYEGVKIDQTKNLGFLPGVGVTRGVELEPYLQLWIEPVSGHMVKYKDDTIAYYYDLKTGVRENPWNRFSNSYTLESVLNQVKLASQEKSNVNLVDNIIPTLLAIFAVLIILFYYRRNKAVKFLSLGIIGVAVLTIVGMWFVPKFSPPTSYTGPRDTVHVGVLHFPATAPMLVAIEKGYFEEQGLDLDIKVFDSGKTALGAMLTDGNLDIVNVAQTPIVVNSFDRQDFVILSGLSSSPNDAKILIRNDRGIHEPKDLQGKTVGITKGTTGHYFLGLFLAKHSLNLDEITTIDLPASNLPEALKNGSVDAISSWEPHIYNAQKILGTKSSLLESDNTFRTDYYLVALGGWAKNNPEIVKRFLAAIDKANNFIAEHSSEAQNIVATRTNLEPNFIQSVWNDYQFHLFLDQSLLLALEQQARWAQANKIVSASTTPDNYLDFIYFDALEVVKPEAVTIIH